MIGQTAMFIHRIVFLVLICTVVCFLGGANVSFAEKTVDWKAYCADEGETAIFLIDVTTPYDSIDKDVLTAGFEAIISSLKGGDKIIVRTISDDPTHSKKLFDKCIPYCPERSTLDELFSDCTQGVILNHKRFLMSELGSSIRTELDSFVELPHSAIIQTISKSVAEDVQKRSATKIFIFSDMIENSIYVPGKTFWKSKPIAVIDLLTKDALIPDMKGMKVSTFGVGRSGGSNRTPLEVKLTRILTTFWTIYFERAGIPGVKLNHNLTVQD